MSFVARKGKVDPGKFRACGYERPGHRRADLRLKWRAVRLSAGLAPQGSSPAAQETLQLNRDATFAPKTPEGDKARKSSEVAWPDAPLRFKGM